MSDVVISQELAALAISVMREAAGALYNAPGGNQYYMDALLDVARELDRKLSATVRKEATGGS